jgi:hypothetical protein
MHLYLVPPVSSRLGLPVILSSASLLQSYDSEASEQLATLLRELPQLEAPFKFFTYAYHAYDFWLNCISAILAVENPAEGLFDRLEWGLSSYLLASKAAIDHLRSRYGRLGLDSKAINSRVEASKKLSTEFRFGEALRHYVAHTATPVSNRHTDYSLTRRYLRIVFHKADAKEDAAKPGTQGWRDVDLLEHLPDEIDLPEYLKHHYLMTMNYVGAHFFSKVVLPYYKELWKLLRLPKDRDLFASTLHLVENSGSENISDSQHLGLVCDCSALLRKHEFLLSVFLLPRNTLEIS